MTTEPPVRAVPSKWGPVALVCRKCGKKLGGGFGSKGGKPLAKALRRFLEGEGRRRALRLVETGCLGVCPKGAVAVALSDRVLIVRGGADPGIVAASIAGENATTAAAGTGTPAGPGPEAPLG